MKPETKREIVILLARAVAHLYAIAGTLAARREWNAADREAELVRVLEMLKRAYDQLAPLPDCAESVLEQFMVIRNVQESALDDVQAAMTLARAGLIINTWCTATTMLVSAQATDGPLTIGGLLQTLGTLQPDPRYQAAVAERLAATAYDNSAAHQLGNCYFQAYEGFSLLELQRLLSTGDTSHAADLLDNASRGALTAVRFLEREPLDEADEADEADEVEANDSEEAEPNDSDGTQAQARDGAQAQADDQPETSDGAQVQPDHTERMASVKAARDPPASARHAQNSPAHWR